MTAVCVVPVPVPWLSKPTERLQFVGVPTTSATAPEQETAEPVTDALVASCKVSAAVVALSSPAAALAAGVPTTDTRPAVSAVTATSAMRLRSVFVDMFFLSLVRFRNFLDLARRSFDLLIPLLL
jgi:hypothetical protein